MRWFVLIFLLYLCSCTQDIGIGTEKDCGCVKRGMLRDVTNNGIAWVYGSVIEGVDDCYDSDIRNVIYINNVVNQGYQYYTIQCQRWLDIDYD